MNSFRGQGHGEDRESQMKYLFGRLWKEVADVLFSTLVSQILVVNLDGLSIVCHHVLDGHHVLGLSRLRILEGSQEVFESERELVLRAVQARMGENMRNLVTFFQSPL